MTVAFVSAVILTSGGLTIAAFVTTGYLRSGGSIERFWLFLMASIGAGLVGGILAWLIRRRRSRRPGIILTGFLALGAAVGYLYGRWIADGITLCVDGVGIRTGCGTPWFDGFIKPTYAGGAYAGLGGVIGLTLAVAVVGLIALRKRRRAAPVAM